MLEKKLNLTQKISFTISGILGLAIAGFFAYTSIFGFTLDGHESHEVVIILQIIRGTFAFGSIMALLWSGMMFWILKKGTFNIRRDNKITAGWTWGITLTIMVTMLVIGGRHPNAVNSVFMVVSALVFFIMGAVFLLIDKISQSELNTKEQLLRMELKLTELSEIVKKNG